MLVPIFRLEQHILCRSRVFGGLFVQKVPGLAVLGEGAGELGEFVPELEPAPDQPFEVRNEQIAGSSGPGPPG